ncbi:MAG: hypothetical protein ACQRW7_03250 [Caulobacterales bacterium]|uniref:hypothetical protein n=1 Tax=Glycocaulis sp. TaxID=1969725 RepID=UPI003FA0480B
MSLIARTRQYRDQIAAQMTPRAWAGAAILSGLLLIAAIASLSDHVAAQRDTARQLERELRVFRALAAESNWADRAAELAADLDVAQAPFWQGRTAGIVSAQLQGEMTRLASEAGISRVNVEVRPDPLPLGDEAVYFELRLSGEDRDGQFLALFNNLASYPNLIVPAGVEWQRANGLIRMQLIAPAVIGAPEEAAP